MAVKQINKNKPVHPKISYSKMKKPKIIAVLVILLAILGFAASWAVHMYQAGNEKQDFLAKQQVLDGIADKISAQNKPDERNSFEFCRYQSGKYQKGDLYCSVGVELTYNQISIDQANTLTGQAAKLSGGEKVRNYLSSSETSDAKFVNLDTNKVNYLVQDFKYLPSDYKCGASFSYLYPTIQDDNLKINLSCIKLSKASHFELQK